jgi:adenylate kinase family enzyme
MKLIVIRGAGGSGKSSVASKLHEESVAKTAYLPLDFFRVDVAKEQHSAAEIASEILEFSAKKYIDNSYCVIMEGLFNWQKDHWKRLVINLINYCGEEESQIVFLGVHVDTAVARNRQRSKGKLITDDDIRDWHPKSQPTLRGNELVIDTNDRGIDEIVNIVANKVGFKMDLYNPKTKIHSYRQY